MTVELLWLRGKVRAKWHKINQTSPGKLFKLTNNILTLSFSVIILNFKFKFLIGAFSYATYLKLSVCKIGKSYMFLSFTQCNVYFLMDILYRSDCDFSMLIPNYLSRRSLLLITILTILSFSVNVFHLFLKICWPIF